jgi:WS/DGAT/MGAT family acyltransferase
MDRPANPMVIIGVLILEGPVDLDQLEETVAERFLAIPRFKQRVESRNGELWWADDPYFERSRHIRRVRLPGKGGQAELQRYIAEHASETLDKARPLWQLRIVEDYEGGAAIVIRIHHAVGDGMALVGVMLSVTDGGDQRIWTARRGETHSRSGLPLPGLNTFKKGIGLTAGLWKEAAALAAHPAKTARIGAGVAGELAYLLLMPEDSWTRFKGKPSGNKRVAWTDPIPLTEVKAVSKALGCTINDMLLASVAGALCDYLKSKGDPTEGVEIRALVPVDMRRTNEAGQLGNKFGIVGVELPVGIENPLERLLEVRRRMHALKHSLEPPVTLGLFAVLGYAPQVLQDKLFNMLLRRATAVMTNVPGPQTPLYFAGALIKQIMFWVPQSGDIGMGVSILSFNGMVQFGLITDAQMVPDPEAIIARFRPNFEQLLYHVLMSDWGGEETRAVDKTAVEKPAAPARKSRSAPQPRAKSVPAKDIEKALETTPPRTKSARTKPAATPPQESVQTKPAAAPLPQSRSTAEPRTRGSRTKLPAPPKRKSVSRRKLPRQ